MSIKDKIKWFFNNDKVKFLVPAIFTTTSLFVLFILKRGIDTFRYWEFILLYFGFYLISAIPVTILLMVFEKINDAYFKKLYKYSLKLLSYLLLFGILVGFYYAIPDIKVKNTTNTQNKIESKGQYRIGAICCDGTHSYSTGRGTCSHHGGVCRWLYADDK